MILHFLRRSLKRGLVVMVVLVIVSYPFIIHHGLAHVELEFLAICLFTLVLLRFLLAGQYHQRNPWLQVVLVGIFCLGVDYFDSVQLLKYYPVLMNLLMASVFSYSLLYGVPLVERFVRKMGKEPTPQGLVYMRNLTLAWALVLASNASMAAYTACCMSTSFWAFYNGFLSYFLLMVFFLIELPFRAYYKKRYQLDHDNE